MADALITKLADKAVDNANNLQAAMNTIKTAITTLGSDNKINSQLSISNAIEDMQTVVHATPVDNGVVETHANAIENMQRVAKPTPPPVDNGVDNGVTETHTKYIPLSEDIMPYGVKFYNQEDPNGDILTGKNANFRYGIDFYMEPNVLYTNVITQVYLDLYGKNEDGILGKYYCILNTGNICIVTVYEDHATYAYSTYVVDGITFAQMLIVDGVVYIPIEGDYNFRNAETGEVCTFAFDDQIFAHFSRAVTYDLKYEPIYVSDQTKFVYAVDSTLYLCELLNNRLTITNRIDIIPDENNYDSDNPPTINGLTSYTKTVPDYYDVESSTMKYRTQYDLIVGVDNYACRIDMSKTNFSYDLIATFGKDEKIYNAVLDIPNVNETNIFYTSSGIYYTNANGELFPSNTNITKFSRLMVYEGYRMVALDTDYGRILYSGFGNESIHRPKFSIQSFCMKSAYLDEVNNTISIPMNDFSVTNTDIPSEIIIVSRNFYSHTSIHFRNITIPGVNPYFIDGHETSCYITYTNPTDGSVRKYFESKNENGASYDVNTRTLHLSIVPSAFITYIKNNLTDVYDMYMILE